MVCVLAACQKDGVCTCSKSQVCFVYWQQVKCMLCERQNVIGMVCVLAVSHKYGVCIGRMS